MKIFDISMPICPDMPVYKGNPAKKPLFGLDSHFSSNPVYETRLTMNMHTGTHIDCSLHMFTDGTTVDQLQLEDLITPCKVFDFSTRDECISQTDLEGKQINAGDFVLLKTKNSYLNLLEGDYVYLDKSGAAYLKSKNILGIGIDALGIERNQPRHETHKILFRAGIIIIEGLRLRDIAEDRYLLIAVPLHIVGTEAAPVRAILIKGGMMEPDIHKTK